MEQGAGDEAGGGLEIAASKQYSCSTETDGKSNKNSCSTETLGQGAKGNYSLESTGAKSGRGVEGGDGFLTMSNSSLECFGATIVDVAPEEEAQAVPDRLLAALDELLQRHHDRLLESLHRSQAEPQAELSPTKCPRDSVGLKSCGTVRSRASIRKSVRSDGSYMRSDTSVYSGEDPVSPHSTRSTSRLGSKARRFGSLVSFNACEELKRQETMQFSKEFLGQHGRKSWTTSGARDSMEQDIPFQRGSTFLVEGMRWWQRARLGMKRIMASSTFEIVMSFIIMSNTIFCGVEVDYMAQHRLDVTPEVFKIISMSYAALFAFDLFLRLFVEGSDFVREPNWAWNLFDTLVVLISFVEICVDASGDVGEASPGAARNVRVIRMARVVRVLRIARIMRHFRSLRILIYSVVNTLRSLLWTLLLLTLILYVFAIVFTQATTQHLLLPESQHIDRLEEAYGSISRSMFSLFKAISGGVSWEDITRPLGMLHPAWLTLFLIYFSFTYFAVLNVVTGVFCQTAIESANTDHEMALQTQMASKQQYVKDLKRLFEQLNSAHTGLITLEELEDGLDDEKMKAYFAKMDLSVDEAYSLFKLLDTGEDHVLDFDTFVTGCLKLRGHAKSIDIAMMMYENRWKLEKCIGTLKSVEELISAQMEPALSRSNSFTWQANSAEDEVLTM